MATQNPNPNSQDFDTSVNARPATRDEIAYRDGYVRGKAAEQREYDRRRAAEARMYEENARLRADNGVSTGLILGFVLAGVAAVVGGALYVYNDMSTPTATPEATTPQEPSTDTTIIQRTIERTREVVPAPTQIQLPEVNPEINVTPPAPAPEAESSEPAPATDDAQTAEPSSQPQ